MGQLNNGNSDPIRRADADERRKGVRRTPSAPAGTSGAPSDAPSALPTALVLDRLLRSGRLRADRRRSLACAVLAIDDLDTVESVHGKPAATRAIRSAGEDLIAQRGPSDLLFTLGLGRFAVLRAGGELGESWAWCEELRTRVRDTRLGLSGGGEHAVTLSIGLHACEPAAFTIDALELVHTALAVARERGGNQVCTWDSVVIDRICDHAATANPRSPVAGFAEVCRRLEPRLGRWQARLAIAHGDHAASLARAIDARLGATAQAGAKVAFFARLASLAAAEIPESVLATADRLTHGERLIVATRAAAAARIAERLGLDEADTECVRQSLGRFDAAGDADAEPSGCQPRDARVVGAALACAAMLEPRAHRGALPVSEIVREIEREAGGQFAPDVAPAAAAVVNAIGSQPVRIAA